MKLNPRTCKAGSRKITLHYCVISEDLTTSNLLPIYFQLKAFTKNIEHTFFATAICFDSVIKGLSAMLNISACERTRVTRGNEAYSFLVFCLAQSAHLQQMEEILTAESDSPNYSTDRRVKCRASLFPLGKGTKRGTFQKHSLGFPMSILYLQVSQTNLELPSQFCLIYSTQKTGILYFHMASNLCLNQVWNYHHSIPLHLCLISLAWSVVPPFWQALILPSCLHFFSFHRGDILLVFTIETGSTEVKNSMYTSQQYPLYSHETEIYECFAIAISSSTANLSNILTFPAK